LGNAGHYNHRGSYFNPNFEIWLKLCGSE
jgi:hypothetical protein